MGEKRETSKVVRVLGWCTSVHWAESLRAWPWAQASAIIVKLLKSVCFSRYCTSLYIHQYAQKLSTARVLWAKITWDVNSTLRNSWKLCHWTSWKWLGFLTTASFLSPFNTERGGKSANWSVSFLLAGIRLCSQLRQSHQTLGLIAQFLLHT